jgi:hypothetical protein
MCILSEQFSDPTGKGDFDRIDMMNMIDTSID